MDADTTSAGLVNQYAEDSDTWLQDFKVAIEKMLRNGYSEQNNNALQDGPTAWFDVKLKSFRKKEGFTGTWPINYSQ